MKQAFVHGPREFPVNYKIILVKYLLFCTLQFKDRKFDENCEDDVYRERHRIPREAVDFLEEKLHNQLSYQSRRNRPLTPRQQVSYIRYCLSQACQTGGPRAACGPIGCLMWPAWIFYDPYMIENYNKLNTFKVISVINLVIFIEFIYFFIYFTKIFYKHSR